MQHSLYLHIPFCEHRCAYCDFNTYAGQSESIPAYVTALYKEIEHVCARAPAELRVHTIYFGGGTPSLLAPHQVGGVLNSIRASFSVDEGAEVTLEANPGTVSTDYLAAVRESGINRLSFGVQSANGEELRLLERQHSYLDAINAVAGARRAGFENVNLDLIYGLPEQTLATWQITIKRILDLCPEHVSAYALTLEHGTPFGAWSRRGLLSIPDPDLAADMYEWLSAAMEAAGYAQYEISNWAKGGRACRHNLQYWRGSPYLGFGAGAHGYAGGYRYSNSLRIGSFIDRLIIDRESEIGRHPGTHGSDHRHPRAGFEFPFSPAMIDHHQQSKEDDMSEFMIMGLRLTEEGLAAADFLERFGRSLRDVYPKELQALTQLGLLEWESAGRSGSSSPMKGHGAEPSEVIRLTARGRLLGNQVFMRFTN